MKRMEIFCASQASTAICMSMDQASCSSSSSTIQLGGKAIDRHNPIIRDSRRFTRTGIPTNPCVSQPLPFDPKPYQYHQLQKTKSKKSSSTKQSDKKAKKGLLKENDGITRKSSFDAREQQSDVIARKSSFDAREQQSDVTARKSSFDARDKVLSLSARKSWVLPPDLITPPGSSRYLLSDAGFFDGITDYEPVLPLPPVEPKKNQSFNQDETIDSKNSASSRLEKPPKDQVVVLRVSLHCKGCEGKLRKHLSRMEGVTSFNIDFAAKKVTVVGNVTPLSVLDSVSKVKNAQFWTSAMAAPSAVAIPAPPASTNLIAVKK